MSTRAEWDRWEEAFDAAARLAERHRWKEAGAAVAHLRSWQRRRTRYGDVNNSWHDGELLWLEGLVSRGGRRAAAARRAWSRLARLVEAEGGLESFYLPRCPRCLSRPPVLGTNWLAVARSVRPTRGSLPVVTAALEQAATADTGGRRGRPP